MSNPARNRSIAIALWANAALLAGIGGLLLFRGGGGTPAFAAAQPIPIAGGGSTYLMPAQLSTNSWGCYVMDIDAQTLCVYQYLPGDRTLHFVAARDFHFDRKLTNYNTAPSPDEIKNLVDVQDNARKIHANDATTQGGE